MQAAVPGIRDQLCLLDQLRFSEAGEPRCRVSRIEVYRHLISRGILANVRFFAVDNAKINGDLELELPSKAISHLRAIFQGDQISYQVATDTKGRLARALMKGTSKPVYFDIRFLISFAATSEQLTIFTVLKQLGLNVIRYRVRILPDVSEAGSLSGGGRLAELVASVVRVGDGETRSIDELKRKLQKDIASLTKMIRDKSGEDQTHIRVL